MGNENCTKNLLIVCLGSLAVICGNAEVRGQAQMATPQVVRVIRISKSMQHWDKINCVAYSPDGRTLASASSDKTVIIWSPETSRELQIFMGHQSAVTCVAFSPDGKLLVSGDADGVTKVWAGETGRELHNLKVPREPWRPARRGRQPVNVRAVAFSPDGTTLASASQGTTTLWSVDTGQEVRKFSEEKLVEKLGVVVVGGPFARQQVDGIAFSPDGKILTSTNRSGYLTLWSAATGERLRILNKPVGLQGVGTWSDPPRTDAGLRVAVSPDGKMLASIDEEEEFRSVAKLWSVETGEEIRTLRRKDGGAGDISNLVFSPDGETLAASARIPSEITLWSVQTGKVVASRKTGGNDTISSIAFNPNGKSIAYVPFPNRTVKLWAIDSADEPGDPMTYLRKSSAALSRDGKTLASASFEKGHGVVKLWSAETGQELRTLVSQEDTMFTALTFNHSSEVLACWSFDLNQLAPQGERAHVRTFSTQTGRELQRVSGSASVLLSILVFSKDGNTLAGSAGCPFEGIDFDRQGSIKLWNAETLEELRTITGHQKAIFSLAFSPDGSTLASGSVDRTVKLWSVQSGTERLTFTGHAEGASRAVVVGDTHDAVRILAFSPDGKTLVSGTVDLLKLWSTDTGEEIQTLTPPKERLSRTTPPWLTGAIFSPDGRTLASASWDGTLILWDPTSGRQRHSWVFPGKTTLLGFSPDGRLLATENANGTCYLLRVPPHKP